MDAVKKAYVIELKAKGDPEDIDFVKAETRGKAICKSTLYPDFDYIQLKATRLPYCDNKPLTDKNIYDSGRFMVTCRECGCIADDGNGGDPLFDNKDRAYCGLCRPDLIGVRE